MRRHARSEKRRRIVPDLGGGAAAEDPAAEIGSRVFPLRAPPPTASPVAMPTVGTRRSTKIFVPKSKNASSLPSSAVDAEEEAAAARVLRSGKRLALSKPVEKPTQGRDEWLRLLGGGSGGSDHRWSRDGERKGILGVSHGSRETDRKGLAPHTAGTFRHEASPADPLRAGAGAGAGAGSFPIVYARRKRPRPSDTGSASSPSSTGDVNLNKDKKYGIVFTRKQRRKRPNGGPTLAEEAELSIPCRSRNLAASVGIPECDVVTHLDGPILLAALVESKSSSLGRFSRLLVSILRCMRISRVRIRELCTLLLGGSVAGVFSLHGVHFLPVRCGKNNDVMWGVTAASCGLCNIYGARKFTPMLWVNFSALPSYFISLHVALLLGALYLPAVLRRYLMGSPANMSLDVEIEENDSDVHVETGSAGANLPVSLIPTLEKDKRLSIKEVLTQSTEDGDTAHGLRLQKHQKKRSSLRHSRSRHLPLRKNTVVSPSEAKRSSLLEPINVKALDSSLSDLLSNIDENGSLTPIGSHGKQKRSAVNSPIERMKEKLALAEVKQNIDSVHCKANILAVHSDMCSREEGAEIMLEVSDNNEWFLAVKVQDDTRIFYKPNDLRPCVVNRFTHAYMWTVEDGWKLEFLEKWDWLLFKELHTECRVRNSQDSSGKVIPIPGVQSISDQINGHVVPFVRPDEYIKVINDEVGRALAQESPFYDMDSGDERWLDELNSNRSDAMDGSFDAISREDFERIISIFEKDAYNNPDEDPDFERLAGRCADVLGREILLALYDYWIKKRSAKGVALLRVFQGQPVRRAQLKSFFRKKRSFKRQRSQAGRGKSETLLPGRGKPETFLEEAEKEEALQRIQEADSAANKAVETAIQLRQRAQTLMANANLAVYKSIMALHIAESLQLSQSPDLSSCLLESEGDV
ncbi:uncharacterized protein LOC109707295 isoform X2 [Ananas comosus]|uniref:Enhancer of polycomb-like protein n=1 Tax=Ananas comosus TaxID=4615 RepID=A0A6P5EKT9_ANACO|nr:uncharacterized protein LOC109707295 isoform X2 [Ananas comosus]